MNTTRAIAKILSIALPLTVAGTLTGCAGEGSTEDVATIQGKAQTSGGFIAVFNPDVESPRARARTIASQHGASVGNVYQHAIKGFSFQGTQRAARMIVQNTDVSFIEPDQVAYAIAPKWCPDNPDHPACGDDDDGGDGGGDTSQTTPWGITRVGGPVDGSGGGTAYVIDTGVDLDHPDLNVVDGQNFVSKGKKSADDGNGHGTHVAGTIAAIDDSAQVVGVAAGAPVVGIRVLDNRGSGTYSDIIAGVDYVASVGQPGDVANMSLGGAGHSDALHNAVVNAADQGIKFSVAAGNDSDHAENYEPAHIEHSNVVTVSSIDDQDCLSYFSNYGNPPVDFAAPGSAILSTWKDGGTNTISGTSMAAPHVAGLMLLGPVNSDGNVQCGDPDGTPDPIAHN